MIERQAEVEMGWQAILTALCLVLIIEGLTPALFPARFKSMAQFVTQLPLATVQRMGIALIVTGSVLLMLIRQ